MSRSHLSRPEGRQDGVISVVLALTMALFIALLAVVIDLGQIQGARSTLAAATTAAVERAADVLARGGCDDFDAARSTALLYLHDNAATATLEEFVVTYGAIAVDDVSDCLLVVTTHDVGKVSMTTRDERTPIFSPAFTSKGTSTSAQSSAEWGYVTGYRSGLRPLTLCALHPAYVDFQTYLAQVDAHEAAPSVAPVPDTSLLAAFDVELDGFLPPPDRLPGEICNVNFGEFVNVDFSNAAANHAKLADWIADGTDFAVTLADPVSLVSADCGEGASNQSYGECEGVHQSHSTDQVADVLPVIGDPTPITIPIMIHRTPVCHNGHSSGHCDSANARDHRAYPAVAFARVEVLCARITAYATTALAAAVPDPDALSPTYGTDCAGLSKAAVLDGNPFDDVMMRLRFVAGKTIRSGHLSSRPWTDNPTTPAILYDDANGFLGISVCAADGLDNCRF